MFLRTLAIAVAAGPSWAACPVGADLAAGIVVTWDDGSVEVFRRESDHVVVMDGTYDDGYTVRHKLVQGVYLLEMVDAIDGVIDMDTMGMYRYPLDVTDMPVPTANLSWEVETVYGDTNDSYAESQTHRWGEAQQMRVGDCSYTIVAGQLIYTADDGFTFQEGIHYLEELGIGLLVSYKDDASAGPEFYQVIDIRALR